MSEFTQDYTFNKNASGRVRIWRYSKENGIGELLLDQPNLITKTGASLVAQAIGGVPNSTVTHMYIGYNNAGDATPTIDDTVASFSNYAAIPLAFSPSFASSNGTAGDTGYVANITYFTVYLTGGTLPTGIPDTAQITSLGLVNVVGGAASLFSKLAFAPITYSASSGVAISWGITFRALAS